MKLWIRNLRSDLLYLTVIIIILLLLASAGISTEVLDAAP